MIKIQRDMKANELMLGDIVTFKDSLNSDDGIVPIKIVAIGYQDKGGENEALVSINGCESCDIIEIDDEIVGIPLTPEILEKNGWKHEFDKKDYMVKYDLAVEGKNCWMMWTINEHSLDIQRQSIDMKYNLCVYHIVIPCDYVHELQHALRLCGINFEIQL